MKLESVIKQIVSEAVTPVQFLMKAIKGLGKGAVEAENALIRAIRKEGNLGPKVAVDVNNVTEELMQRAVKNVEFATYRKLIAQKLYNKNQQLFDDIILNSRGKSRVLQLNNAGIPPAFQEEVRNLSKLKNRTIKQTKTTTPSTTQTSSILSKEEQMKIIEPIVDDQLKTFGVAIPRGFRNLFIEEVLKITEKILKQSMPKIEGRGEKFLEYFNKLELSEKEKIFKDIQTQTLKLKNVNRNFIKRFMEYLTFYKDRKGTFITPEDYTKAYKYAAGISAISIAMDVARYLYNSNHDQEFQGRFFDIFGEKGNWIAYGAKISSYIYAPAALVVNSVIAADSIFEYFGNILFRPEGTKTKQNVLGDTPPSEKDVDFN